MKPQITHIKRTALLIIVSLILSSCVKKLEQVKKENKSLTPYQIIAQAPDAHWRDVDLKNIIYLTLDTGIVVAELAPDFAPLHVINTKKLIREGVFDNTSFYRVIDGFVAQGGPVEEDDTKIKNPQNGRLTIAAEFTKSTQYPLALTLLNDSDDYADEVGYFKGFPVGRSLDKKQNWLLHCYGALAMGRANDANSGGTELYIVNGPAQRYLDKNTTVFGRVIAGMEHIQALKRSQNIFGAIDMKGKNTILKIQLGSDIKTEKIIPLQVLKTDSTSFINLIKSRKNRTGEWFLYQHNYIDVCSVPVPVRLKK